MKLASMTSWSTLLRGSNSRPTGAASRWRQASAGLCSLALASGLFAQAPVVITITDQPDSRVVLADPDPVDPLVFSVTANVTEGDTLEFQWFKNGVLLPGQTDDQLSFASITPADAGNYTCLVQAVLSEVEQLSDPAVLVVASAVTGDPQTLNEGGNLRLSIPAPAAPARPVLSYSWYLGETLVANVPLIEETGRSIRGATTRTLSIAKLLPSDDGIYTGVLSGYGDNVTIGTFDVTVRPRPILDTVEVGPFEWRVGDPVDIDLNITNGEDVGDVTFTASRLPAGLSINPETGVVSGRPLRATTEPVSFRVTATTAQGLKSIPVDFPYSIAPIPTGLDGVYLGLFTIYGPGAPGGSIRLHVTQTGAFTGTIVRGAVTTPFSGLLETNASGGDLLVSTLPGLDFFIEPQGDGLAVFGTYNDGDDLWGFQALRQITPANELAGQYNVGMRVDFSEFENPTPSGDSYATLKVIAKTGVVRYAGRMADGTVVTAASAVTGFTAPPPGMLSSVVVPIYRPLYANGGSLQGDLQISELGGISFDFIRWARPAIAGNLYPDGFSALLSAFGGKYSAPAPGDVILGLTAGANNAVLALGSAALDSNTSQSLTIAAPASTTVNLPLSGNLSKLVINRLDPATGLFFGSASFTDTVSEVTSTRKTKFYGLVLPGYSSSVGYFLLNEVGSNNVLSGQATIGSSEPVN